MARVRKSVKSEGLGKQKSSPRTDEEMKLLKSIGNRIHKELHHLGKPVEWLAFESETSRATIRRIFDADRNIGVVTLDRVAKALGYKDIIEFFKKG